MYVIVTIKIHIFYLAGRHQDSLCKLIHLESIILEEMH